MSARSFRSASIFLSLANAASTSRIATFFKEPQLLKAPKSNVICV